MSAPVRTGVAAAARCLGLDQLAVEVVEQFRRAGIATVLLKGAGLAQRLYPDPDQRRYSDVDLLVAPDTFDRAQQVLAQQGFVDRSAGLREDELQSYERSWRLPGPQALTVDLHRGFAGVGDPTRFWELVSAETDAIDLGGVSVRVPGAAGCALVVGLHAAVPGPGRKPLTDLTQALALLADPVWDEAAELARLTGSTGAFARGLRTHPAGRALADRLHLRAAGTLADDLVARQVGGSAISLAKLLDVRGPWAKVGFVLRRLSHSPALMRKVHPIARRGAVGLAAAYAFRVGRMVACTPRAVLAVGSARRDRAPQRRPRRPARWRVLRRVADLDARDRATCLWTLRSLSRARQQLAGAPLADLDLAGPPAAGRGGARTVERVLAHRGASCMEAAVVMQRWLAGQGLARDLLIGVSAPGNGFRAHAWLEDGRERLDLTGPAPHDHHRDGSGLVEIHRRPTPAGWLAPR